LEIKTKNILKSSGETLLLPGLIQKNNNLKNNKK